MINIPNINLNNTRTKILIGIICIYLFIMNYLSIQLLLSILLLFFIVINYSDFNEKIVNQVFTKKKRNDLNYNHKIELSLNRLRKYKKYNLTSYNSGKEYWRKYIKYLKKLENDVSELKSVKNPTASVELCLKCVLLYLGHSKYEW